MVGNFIKYTIPAFWIILLLVQANIVPKVLAYTVLGIYIFLTVLFLFKNPRLFLHKAFTLFIVMSLVTLLYFLIFDFSVSGFEYFAARTVTFAMIAIAIYYYHDYLIENYAKIIIWFGFAFMIYGVLTNHNFGGRYSGPFWNPNSLGWIASLLFGLTLFEFEKGRKKYLLLAFFLALALMSGSRAAFGGIVLALLINGQISVRNIFFLIFAFIVLMIGQKLASQYGFHTGLERLISSEHTKQGVLSGREFEWLYSLEAIMKNPVAGYGLDHYAHIPDEILIKHGVFRVDKGFAANPHNSFLAVMIQYGLVFGTFILSMLIYYIGKIIVKGCPKKSLLFMTIYSFLSAGIESYLFGVSGFEGFTFWSALPLCLIAIYTHNSKKAPS